MITTSTLALATGCNPADVKDRAVQFPTSQEVEEGGFAAILAGTVSVDAAARESIERWEVEAGAGFVYQTDDPPSGDISLTTGFLEEKARGGLVDGGADALWDNVDFAGCDEAGFEVQEDGGCVLGVVVFVGVDRAAQFTSELSAKGRLPDDSSVDPETLRVSVSYEAAE